MSIKVLSMETCLLKDTLFPKRRKSVGNYENNWKMHRKRAIDNVKARLSENTPPQHLHMTEFPSARALEP